jgi:Family of unknown function (DUF5990)
VKQELKLRIILEKPPSGVDFGLQKGRGSDYETVDRQRSGSKDLRFECMVTVSAARGGSGLHLSGPYVQGPSGGKFLYLDIGTYAGQKDSCWSRRLKIPLSGIPSDVLGTAKGPLPVLEARVPGTGRDKGPSCGTVKPFAGWRVQRD